VHDYVSWFRDSTPYISAHRGKTFVICLPQGALATPYLIPIIHDLSLLSVLGVRLVLVHDLLPETDVQGDATASAIGQTRAHLESLFSMGLPNTPLHKVEVPIVGGNLVVAQPLGVVDGIDQGLSGTVRSINTARINKLLDLEAVVLLSPLGHSPSGQTYYLRGEELACQAAIALQADKLIYFDACAYVADASGPRRELTLHELEKVLASDQTESHLTTQSRQHLVQVLLALEKGVGRGVLVSYTEDGALLEELFTAKGGGTQIAEDPYRIVRQAQLSDLSAITELIRPLEESGTLIPRSKAQLEQEIDRFFVAEVDSTVIGCCARTLIAGWCELSCLAVHPSHQRSHSGESVGSKLLKQVENTAQQSSAVGIYAQTTRARDWFIEQGFCESDLAELPSEVGARYNAKRNSKILTKKFQET